MDGRRLVSALYQVKVELNRADDKEARPRQPFPEFVPDQFIVLFGLKSLAIKSMYNATRQRRLQPSLDHSILARRSSYPP